MPSADAEFRDSVVHSLRSSGWSQADAIEEADEKLAKLKANPAAVKGVKE